MGESPHSIMGKNCDICLDKECKGKSCNCDTCKNKLVCYKSLRPTIRITTKCTQACSHCCFECSPKSSKMMTLATAVKINQFLHNNRITQMNLMGGEFFCNPDWFEILSAILKEIPAGSRLVSNGDWVINRNETRKLIALAKTHGLKVSISHDRWHTNANVEAAVKVLTKHGIPCNSTEEEGTNDSMVPVGRAMFDYSMYSSMMCYCRKPDRMYSFLIDEVGEIYKCAFGAWNYADIDEYLLGGFRRRFKKVNSVFYGQFIASCKSCLRMKANMPKQENQEEYRVGELKRYSG
jgi:hypothetical protein